MFGVLHCAAATIGCSRIDSAVRAAIDRPAKRLDRTFSVFRMHKQHEPTYGPRKHAQKSLVVLNKFDADSAFSHKCTIDQLKFARQPQLFVAQGMNRIGVRHSLGVDKDSRPSNDQSYDASLQEIGRT